MSESKILKQSIALKPLKDSEIIKLVKSGDTAKYAELVQRHEQVMFRVVVRMVKDPSLAEDIVQDALIKGLTKIDLFKGDASFKSWVIKIAINTAKNKLRKLKRENVELQEFHLGVYDKMDQKILHTKMKKAIQELVDNLPNKQKRAIALRVFKDLSFKEVAYMMDCPYDTAKANYRHALIKLRKSVISDEIFNDWKEITA